jgi:hypothetical protein
MFGPPPINIVLGKRPELRKELRRLEKERQKKKLLNKGMMDMMLKKYNKVKKNMGGVMRKRGGTFKGTF